jgi:uncharacterized protein YkwD
VPKVPLPSVRVDAGGCPYAGNVVGDVSDARHARATICPLNRERARHGLSQLRTNGDLDQAAQGHARDMVKRAYFSHVSPDGSGPAQRLGVPIGGDRSDRPWVSRPSRAA